MRGGKYEDRNVTGSLETKNKDIERAVAYIQRQHTHWWPRGPIGVDNDENHGL